MSNTNAAPPAYYGQGYMAQQGASNPSGLALSIHKACVEATTKGGTDAATSDPDIRLMVHQLASLFRLGELEYNPGRYSEMMAASRDRQDDVTEWRATHGKKTKEGR